MVSTVSTSNNGVESMTTEWKTYEEVATYLLNQFASEFGLSKVEGKQSMPNLRSQTEWEIDAKGVREGNERFVIIECRRYTTSKQNQDKLGSLAYKNTCLRRTGRSKTTSTERMHRYMKTMKACDR